MQRIETFGVRNNHAIFTITCHIFYTYHIYFANGGGFEKGTKRGAYRQSFPQPTFYKHSAPTYAYYAIRIFVRPTTHTLVQNQQICFGTSTPKTSSNS
jgi:hypothetical protein